MLTKYAVRFQHPELPDVDDTILVVEGENAAQIALRYRRDLYDLGYRRVSGGETPGQHSGGACSV